MGIMRCQTRSSGGGRCDGHFRVECLATSSIGAMKTYTNLLRDGYKIRIFLNDVEQAHCLIADPDEGWIMRHQIAGGKPVLVRGVARTEIVKGNVSIRLERQFRAG